MLREHVSGIGDDKPKTYVRSTHCQQLVGWLAIGDNNGCRRCQIDLRRNVQEDGEDEDRTEASAVKLARMDESNDDDCEHTVELDEEDDAMLNSLLEKMLPGATSEMKSLIISQREALKAKVPTLRRWSSSIVSLCLSMFVRSPKLYKELKDSGTLILPSGRQLQRYKNYIPQKAGLNVEVFKWMHLAAVEAKVPDHGRAGGLIHDEMKIQDDLVLSMRNGTPKLVGWIDTGEEAQNLRILKEGKVLLTLTM